MENPTFVDNQNVPLVTYHDKDYEGGHDDDYDDYNQILVQQVRKHLQLGSSTHKESLSIYGLDKK